MQLKIFYLDDEIDLLGLFSDTFSGPDVVIETFLEPTAFIEAIKKSPPHLAFIDYRLRSTTGIEVANQLPPDLPKFLITGELRINQSHTFKAVLGKPYKPNEIFEILEQFKPKVA